MPATETEQQHWTDRRFVYFKGQFDTRIETGEDYPTQALAKLFKMAPGNKPKGAGLACIPSTYHDYDAREHKAQREWGRFIALTGDVDSGNHGLDVIREGVTAFVAGAAWLIYSSPHARPGDMRWRIILPLAQEHGFEAWHDAQLAFYAHMEARGITMDHALARAAQPVYLPNVPAIHAKSETPLRGPDDKPLYFVREHSGLDKPGLDLTQGAPAEGIAALTRRRDEDERAREVLRQAAEKRRAAMPHGDGASIIDDFNAGNTVAAMLEMCGYEQSPRNEVDWRSPHQTGDTYATRVIGTKWVSLSASDATAGVGTSCASGCYGDAYDLYAHYKHNGDHKAAYRALGAERRIASGNVIYPEQFEEVPAWIAEIPPPDEVLDFADPDYEAGFAPIEHGPAELSVVDAFDFNEADIPTRPWVIPGVMLSGYTHMLAAPGGSGKSLFTLQLAITLALGEPWGSFHPRRKARTLIINVEDDLHEQRRRLAAARRVMGPDQDALRGMVHLVADTDNIIVAGFDEHRRVMVAKPIVPVLVDYIRRNQIDVLIVDPFTETFEGDENDNSEVKWAMRIWRDEIAKATGCAVYLVHHTTKYAAGGAGDANVVRGAGAIVNSTRISATLMPMTQDEAATLGIDEGERNLYVRYDDAKANQSLKSGKARWFQKQSVTLTNGDENHPADEVGALIPWSPPGMLDGISIHAINAALDSIDGGIVDAHGVPTGSRYTYSTKGGTKESGRWAGCVLINQLGMKEGQAGALLKTWMKNGVVVEDTYRDPNRREDRKGLFAPRSARPGDAN